MCSCLLRSFSRWWPLAFLIFSPQTKFSCCFSNKKNVPFLYLLLSVTLFLVELRFAGLLPTFSFSLSSYFSIFLKFWPRSSWLSAKIFEDPCSKVFAGRVCVYFEDLCRNFHEDLCKILKDLGQIIEDPNRLYRLKNSSVKKFARSPSKFLNGRIWNGPV